MLEAQDAQFEAHTVLAVVLLKSVRGVNGKCQQVKGRK